MRKYLSLNTVASKENIFNSVYEAMSIFAITSYNFFNQFGKLIYLEISNQIYVKRHFLFCLIIMNVQKIDINIITIPKHILRSHFILVRCFYVWYMYTYSYNLNL